MSKIINIKTKISVENDLILEDIKTTKNIKTTTKVFLFLLDNYEKNELEKKRLLNDNKTLKVRLFYYQNSNS